MTSFHHLNLFIFLHLRLRLTNGLHHARAYDLYIRILCIKSEATAHLLLLERCYRSYGSIWHTVSEFPFDLILMAITHLFH